MKSQGIPMVPDNGQRKKDWEKAKKGDPGACNIFMPGKEWSEDQVITWVVAFPVKSPKRSVVRNEMTAIDQLEHYKKLQQYWCEHNASCTVYVKDEEWFQVGNWVYQNWEYINGVSFLPYDGGQYEQAPYEEISREQYDKLLIETKQIDYSQLSKFEKEDSTEGAKTLACNGDRCE